MSNLHKTTRLSHKTGSFQFHFLPLFPETRSASGGLFGICLFLVSNDNSHGKYIVSIIRFWTEHPANSCPAGSSHLAFNLFSLYPSVLYSERNHCRAPEAICICVGKKPPPRIGRDSLLKVSLSSKAYFIYMDFKSSSKKKNKQLSCS